MMEVFKNGKIQKNIECENDKNKEYLTTKNLLVK